MRTLLGWLNTLVLALAVGQSSSCSDSRTNRADANLRDCGHLGGGQPVLAERCAGDVVEYCVYSDTTHTATWSEQEMCNAPRACREVEDRACCLLDGEGANGCPPPPP